MTLHDRSVIVFVDLDVCRASIVFVVIGDGELGIATRKAQRRNPQNQEKEGGSFVWCGPFHDRTQLFDGCRRLELVVSSYLLVRRKTTL